jgi:parallel beta-helix repeat protein
MSDLGDEGRVKRKTLSEILLVMLLLSLLAMTYHFQSAEASNRVYIRANGSIEPVASPISTIDNVTYRLTASVSGSIVIQRNNIILDGAGYSVQGSGSSNGVDLSHTANVTVRNTTIENFDTGIQLDSPTNDTVCGNDITGNNVGLYLYGSSGCTIFGNNMTNNSGYALDIDSSSNCTFSGNNIAGSYYDISLYLSFDNIFYHNNFNDSSPITASNSANAWDNGYPSGGNHWSDFDGEDLKSGLYQNETGSDGVGDQPYVVDTDNTDRYPLMGSFVTFDAGNWNGTSCNVDFASNSTVSDLRILDSQRTLSFNVTGLDFTSGFCRITVPNIIAEDLWQGNYTVLSNEEPLVFRNWTDAVNTYIYVNYMHSEHEITIIPELLPGMSLLLMILSALVTIIAKAKTHKVVHSTSLSSSYRKAH